MRFADVVVAEDSKKELSELGMFASMLGHVGDGNFHSAIFYNKKDPEQVEKVKRVVYRMVDKALEMEGTCTGEVSSKVFSDEVLLRLTACSIRLGSARRPLS